ncbi:Vta1 like-domain-containing protein [Cercophora newfieldiana]|uniref:Vta1 like-domain-containing protein n=1 Tax=Cercophora newfieldiana TaxID=92897 RepID=A0AA40CZA2_9PEZI|nr:Vta1 like-domain-containing protein [Cercophora newfieldiana]
MTDSIPAALRQADITIWKCATKAAQLQTVKPIIAYWCEYWVVNQILAKQLHTTDEDVLRYTTTLMDKLEQTKAEYATEDAIVDDTAGQAYVEQFAQETLDRAERVIKANKVTQQTAQTFDAAATFFHLVNIWGTPDTETQQKIKYAKWNAARIAKAIKDGKDPNESNPKPQDLEPQPALDADDPEVQMLGGAAPATVPRPVTVEDVPDVEVRRDAAGVSLPHSPASMASGGDLKLPGVPTELGPPATQSGYFDSETIPSPVSPPLPDLQAPPDLPPAPSGWTQPENGPDIPSAPTGWPAHPPHSGGADWAPPPENFYHQSVAPPPAPPTFATSSHATPAVASPPVSPPVSSYHRNIAPTAHSTRPVAPPVALPPSYAPAPASVDEASIAGAQKHAKWAISALNFEDVNTAVRELRKALEMLGAT